MAMVSTMPPSRKGRFFSFSKVLRCLWVLIVPVFFLQLALLYSCSDFSDSRQVVGDGRDGADGVVSLNHHQVSSVRLLPPAPSNERHVNVDSHKVGWEAEDWFDAERWRSNNRRNNTIATDNCFYVENVCRGGPHRFRYDPRRGVGNVGGDSQPHQPNWELHLTFDGRHFPKARKGFPPVVGIGINGGDDDDDDFEATSTSTSEQQQRRQQQHTCTAYRYSPIRNHVVLQSAHNHMLGEFYDRTLLGLLAVRETMTGASTTRPQSRNQSRSEFEDDDGDGRVQSGGQSPASTSRSPSQSKLESLWMEQTQLYLHVTWSDAAGDPLLDSHRLYLEAFSDNPVLSFYDALLDGSGAGGGAGAAIGDSCRCVRRLFFCGYSQEERARQIRAKPESQTRMTATVRNDKNRGTITDAAASQANTDTDANITILVPERRFGGWKEVESYYDHRPFWHLRKHLQRSIVDNNELLNVEVERYRTQVLRGILNRTRSYNKATLGQRQEEFLTSSILDVGAWRLVGLTQRSGRRKWLNLGKVLQRCNRTFNRHRIACTAVNVERSERRNALSHVVMHRSLHMLVGIHGAQLTDAIWMRDESTVVELLPYVPDEIERGQWARYVHSPTPLGMVFNETELNHVGYRLPRDSAPYCRDQDTVDGVSNVAKDDGADMRAGAYLVDNFTLTADFATKLASNSTRKRNGYPSKGDDSKNDNITLACWKEETWADRDFTVDPRVVKRAIEAFLIRDDGKSGDDAWHRFNGSNMGNDCLRLRWRAARHREGVKDANSEFIGEFVLYNVLCTENPQERIGGNRVHHFYLT